jgi:hypothetical protein
MGGFQKALVIEKHNKNYSRFMVFTMNRLFYSGTFPARGFFVRRLGGLTQNDKPNYACGP